jgi:hypothetical protein
MPEKRVCEGVKLVLISRHAIEQLGGAVHAQLRLGFEPLDAAVPH